MKCKELELLSFCLWFKKTSQYMEITKQTSLTYKSVFFMVNKFRKLGYLKKFEVTPFGKKYIFYLEKIEEIKALSFELKLNKKILMIRLCDKKFDGSRGGK